MPYANGAVNSAVSASTSADRRVIKSDARIQTEGACACAAATADSFDSKEAVVSVPPPLPPPLELILPELLSASPASLSDDPSLAATLIYVGVIDAGTMAVADDAATAE